MNPRALLLGLCDDMQHALEQGNDSLQQLAKAGAAQPRTSLHTEDQSPAQFAGRRIHCS